MAQGQGGEIIQNFDRADRGQVQEQVEEPLSFLKIADAGRKAVAAGAARGAESDNGVEIPNRAGWLYKDEPDSAKIFDLVDGRQELNYRQKAELEKLIENTLTGNLMELSWDLTRDKELNKAFVDVLKNVVKADVQEGKNDYGQTITVKLPGSTESINFGWRGGLSPVSGTTKDGKTVAFESLNKGEENSKALNQIFSNIVHQFRMDYMRPSGLRSVR